MQIGTKFLIVEDDAHDSENIRDALTNLHGEIELANSLEEAIVRTENFLPNAIILDVGIPHSYHVPARVSFDDILQFIRRFKGRHTVIVLTGLVDPTHLRLAMSAGACDYIDKDELRNRQLFEARIINAQRLHERLLLKDDMAELQQSVVTIWALMDLLSKQFRHMREQVGVVQDKKNELLKEQVRKAAIEETNAKWRKWLFASSYTIGWGIWIGLKAGFDKFLKKD